MFKFVCKTFILFWAIVVSHCAIAATQLSDIEGAWLGSMQIPEGPLLRVGVEVFEKADGSWGGNVASLDQGTRYIPVSNVSLINDIFTIDLAEAPISIIGKVDLSTMSIAANFEQGKQQFSLLLKKVDSIPEQARPQTPMAITAYQQQDVRYMNAEDGTWLSGTLTLPKGDGKHPAVMLIAGSGPNHRDSYHQGHRSFKVLADTLTKQGYVVLRADKRGVYKSSGNFNEATLADFAGDSQAAVQFLKAHNQVDNNRIALIGHSEGSFVAAMTGNREDVNGVISLAGPGLSILDVLLAQDQTEPAAKGASKADTDVLLNFSQRFYQIVINNASEEQRQQKLQSLYDNLKGQEAEIVNRWNNRSGTLNVANASNDSFFEFLQQSPVKYWQKFNAPVLVLNGDKDAQVPAKANVEGIVNAIAANHGKVESKIFVGLNHLFQTADTGATDEYATIEETMSPEVLATITTWLNTNI